MDYIKLERALLDKDMMNSYGDKKLFITLYGNLIDETFKKRAESNTDIDKIFNELCIRLQGIQPK
jgi:uncharacterized protein YjfI (DUF2170 family)